MILSHQKKNTCIVIQLHHTVPANIRCIVISQMLHLGNVWLHFPAIWLTFHVGFSHPFGASGYDISVYPLQTYLWDTALTSNLFKSSKANEWLQNLHILWFPETKQESTAGVDPREREPPNLQLWRYQDVVQGCTKTFSTWFRLAKMLWKTNVFFKTLLGRFFLWSEIE